MYKKAHDAIRANPEYVPAPKKKVEKKRFGPKKLTYEERKAKVKKVKETFLQQLEAGEDIDMS